MVADEIESTTIESTSTGTYNGENFYQWNHLGVDYFLYYNSFGTGQWEVSVGGLGFPAFPVATFWKDSTPPCPPLGSIPFWGAGTFDVFTTMECLPIEDSCDCGINFSVTYNFNPYLFQIQVTGTMNGRNKYEWTGDIGFGLENFIVYWDGSKWIFEGNISGQLASLDYNSTCPFSSDLHIWMTFLKFLRITTQAIECRSCGLEDRIFRNYDSIKLPQSFVEKDRGLTECCCVQLVLGSNGESWENDLTSFWIKLSDNVDSASFDILDCEGNVIDSFETNSFPNEPNGYYATCDWGQILSIYGPGEYSLAITYSISGVSGTLLWGDYKLLPYTIQNALKTARVRSIFNGKQMIDGIDFTNSNVESTHRFYGYIGNRQPNMEIDNIIYDNREMKRVIRENLNDYEIITDPEDECILRPLLELFLISENELFISDYNAHNHSYRYLDLPVIVSESPAVEYKDFSRKAVLKCKVADKFKNSRTFY
jgi:hypothetical protein